MFQPLFLKIFYRGQLLKIRPFTEEQISVGSGDGLSLVLPGLAPWHILIEKKQDIYTVLDLDSESGTLLDGKKILEEQELHSGSFLTLGEYQIQFFVGPPPQMQPPPPVSEPDKESSQLPEAVGYSDSISPPASKTPDQAGNVSTPSSPRPYKKSPAPASKPSSPSLVSQAAPAIRPTAPSPQKSENTNVPSPGGSYEDSTPSSSPSFPSSVSPVKPVAKPKTPSSSQQSGETLQNLPPQKLRVGRMTSKPLSPSPISQITPTSEPKSPSSFDSLEEKQDSAFEYSENSSVPLYKEPSDQTASMESAVAEPPAVTPQQKPFIRETEAFSKIGSFKKPDEKGFWNTFAPPDKIKNLDEFLTPSIGNFIEVIVAWKNRILSSHHFSKGSVHIGSETGCEVPVTNLLGMGKYKLLDIQDTAQVFFQGVRGALIQGRERATRQIHPIKGSQNVVLKPYEMVRLDFRDTLKVYVRLKNKPTLASSGKVFKFNVAEMSVLLFSFLLTGLLVFYSGFYAPLFLMEDEKFVEANIQKATVKFTKPPPQPVDYALKEKTQKAQKKAVVVKRKKSIPKKPKKRASLPSKVKPKKKPKKIALKALGQKKGKSSASTRGKKSSKVAVGSLRPGGSLKTGKSGATAKTVAPDPTKMGLLGVFGKGGKLKNLDQGATGSAAGGLVGLAEGATGHAGTRESYGGEGVGTKTKEMVSGGQGSALVGISGIKVKGRGGSLKGMGTGGLGTRGRMNIDIGTDNLDVEGTIDREAILRVIFRNHRRFDHCYQTSLQGNANLQGPLKMQWQILSKGRVRATKAIQDGVGSRSLTNCVANVLKSLKFPAPPSGQIGRISFKFVFSK
ncbi:MAG: AgmX/PglI C-terminal domain-containing protein [Bdellovibrionales bacterium]|nr:AgmX/PglI C-terminal domain-containing protein [Bdellovibrionales bacterium]